MSEPRRYYIRTTPRVQKFIEAVAAATRHLDRAYETRSAFECIVLSAMIIDAQLRIGVLMKGQLDGMTDEVEESLLHQKGGEKHRTERDIMKLAFECGLINDVGYKNLQELYGQRNKCIHRYLISDINHQYVTELVFKYADAIDKVREAVGYIESLQYATGIGLVKARGDGTEPHFEADMKKWLEELADSKERRPNHDA